MIVLCAQRLYTPLEEIQNPLLFIEDGLISAVSSRTQQEIPKHATVIDFTEQFPDSILAPGFVDIHIHGGAGIDVMRASAEELPRLNKFLTTHGVTGYFPTTVAAPMDQTCAALETIADAIEAGAKSDTGGRGSYKSHPIEARPLGIHLEGPFLSHKRPGVHPLENLLAPTPAIFERLWQAARGHVRMMTIAPELPGALEVIVEAARRGVCVGIGHSDALLEDSRAAVGAGARHATHTFNAMRPLDHREPGIVGETLTSEQLTADIIADGIHVAPEVVKLFLQAKGIERSVLITDATAATGMPDGFYLLGPIQVEVKNGRCTLAGDPDRLAGSVLTMDGAVRNVTKFAGWSLQHAVRAATLNPTRAVGIAHQGQLAPGAEANLVLLSADGEVRKTLVRGVA
jgi:N-acetylglucosamine-6-phosphate deacetylase